MSVIIVHARLFVVVMYKSWQRLSAKNFTVNTIRIVEIFALLIFSCLIFGVIYYPKLGNFRC